MNFIPESVNYDIPDKHVSFEGGKILSHFLSNLLEEKMDLAVKMMRASEATKVINQAADAAEERILDSLLVTDKKYKVDLFLGIGGGPEGVLAACALDAFNCKFQVRFTSILVRFM